jgi:hypothetical protein
MTDFLLVFQGGLVTGATDGRVNFWSLANLRDPVESLQVGESVSCLAVAPESETLVCADEMGILYAVSSSQSTLGGGGQRSRRQVRKIEAGEDDVHFGMISAVSTKTLKASARAGLTKGFLRGSGGLFLSSGVDWTVKMWAPAYTDKPLLSLVSHSYDYMSDVQWYVRTGYCYRNADVAHGLNLHVWLFLSAGIRLIQVLWRPLRAMVHLDSGILLSASKNRSRDQMVS